jgi:peptide/nickel transport system substrate-binding protein
VDQPLSDLIPLLSRNRNVKVDTLATAGFLSLMRLNHLQAPFNNPKVRRAVALAINQSDYMGATLGEDRSVWRNATACSPAARPTAQRISLPSTPHRAAWTAPRPPWPNPAITARRW